MRAAALALALVVAFPTLAAAQSGNQKQAEQHFNAAQKLYNSGDYNASVKEFIQAYTLVPANALLFNIGQAYRRAGDKDKALSYYEKYVAFEPGGAQVAEAQDYVRTLKEEIETEKREHEALDSEKRAKADEEARRKQDEDRKRAAAELARKRGEVDAQGRGLRTAGLVIGGAGIVALGVGVALAAGDGKVSGKAAAVGGVGAAAIVTGGILYYMGARQRSNAEAALGKTSLIVPTVTDRSFGVAWITTF